MALRRSSTQLLRRWMSSAVAQASSSVRKNVPRALGLPQDSRLRFVDPPRSGLRGAMLWLLGFYGRESAGIRGGKRLYTRVKSAVERPELYTSFGLEKKFRTVHAMFVLHVWMCLLRLRAEGKSVRQVGQTLYDVFNHDMELRMKAEGMKLTLLITRWMKELEKGFYGAAAAYDKAIQPGSSDDELARVLWRNVFAEDDSAMPSGPDAARVHALASYVRTQIACLNITDSEDVTSGNILLTQENDVQG